MPNTLQIKRGLQINLPTGLAGELLYTSDTKRLYIGDGATNNLLQGASSILTTGMVSFSDSSGKLTGSSSLYWDNANGRLGIGTSSPTVPIHGLVNNQNIVARFEATGTGEGNIEMSGVAPQLRATTTNGASGFRVSIFGSTTGDVFRLQDSTTTLINVKKTGNVLINTTTDAGFRLDVNGTARLGANSSNNDILGNLNFQNGSNAAYIMQANSTARSLQIPGTAGNADWVFRNSAANFGLQGIFANGTFKTNGADITFTTSSIATINCIGVSGVQGGDNRNIYVGAGVNLYSNEKGYNIRLTAGLGGTSGFDRVGGDVFLTPGIGGGSARNGYVILAHNGTNTIGNVGIGIAAPNASSILDVTSTTRGFLPPRMTTTQINAIASPAEGLQVYNTTISHMCFYQSGSWVRINHSPM